MKTKLDALIHEKTQCITEIYKLIISKGKSFNHDPFTNTQHRNPILKKIIPNKKTLSYPFSPTFPRIIYYVSN